MSMEAKNHNCFDNWQGIEVSFALWADTVTTSFRNVPPTLAHIFTQNMNALTDTDLWAQLVQQKTGNENL